ncbi:MAG: hypothetical protein HGA75_11960 [Thiobacillus sp.]|nr:hypothetical protein [Thiobacillus sp.]
MDNLSLPAGLKAFVIGPIGDKDAEDGSDARIAYEQGIHIFEEVIEPACKAFGLEPIRADMISRTGEIPEQIFRQLRDCPVVIADLTGANPNVMYELGLRHTTGKVTLQIGEKGRLPFDVAAIRTIMFRRTDAGLVQARKDLAKALATNLDTGGDPVTATRIWFEPTVAIEGLATETKYEPAGSEDESEDDAPGFLELLADMESGILSLVQTMQAAITITEDIGEVYSEATNNVRHADARGGGAAARLAIADQTAKKLDVQAERLEVVSGEYAQTVDRIEPGIKYVLTRLAEDAEELAALPNFPLQIDALSQGAAQSIDGALVMRSNALDMGKASRSLRHVGQRLAPSFKRFADTSSRIASWCTLLDGIQKPTSEHNAST